MNALKLFLLFAFLLFYSAGGFAQTLDNIDSNKVFTDTVITISDSVKFLSDSIKISSDSVAVISDTLNTDTPQKDSTKIIYKEIIPIYNIPFNSHSFFIKQNEIENYGYRYSANLFEFFPLSFLRDLGISGMPNELLIYGTGANDISFISNGFTANNRMFNSLDLNEIQSEQIDSIEIIPSYKSFIYGTSMNSVAVNFINLERFGTSQSKAPFTRIRYYQAPSEEAMIDFIYNAFVSNKLTLFFDITNRSADTRFTSLRNFPGADFNASNSWKATARINYFLSNKFNIGIDYKHIKLYSSLYGGIYIDSVQNITENINELLYNNAEAPLNYVNRYQKVKSHFSQITFTNKFIENNTNKISAYFKFDQTEFRLNENSQVPGLQRIFNNNKYNLYGVDVNNHYENRIINFNTFANFEKTDFDLDFIGRNKYLNSFKLSGTAGFNLFNNLFYPSLFAGYQNYDGKYFTGSGADVNLRILNSFVYHIGYSDFQKPYSLIEKEFYKENDHSSKEVFSFETGIKFSGESTLANLIYFYRNIENELVPLINQDSISAFQKVENQIHGVGLKFNQKLWKIILNLNPAFYYSAFDSKRNFRIPEFTFNGSIFYNDILFDDNLNLHTGFLLKSFGKLDFTGYDFERYTSGINSYFESNDFFSNSFKTNSTLIVDFSIIGTIRRQATLYFTIENIFDKKYFIIPFYPMFERGMRLGFSWEFLN